MVGRSRVVQAPPLHVLCRGSPVGGDGRTRKRSGLVQISASLQSEHLDPARIVKAIQGNKRYSIIFYRLYYYVSIYFYNYIYMVGFVHLF